MGNIILDENTYSKLEFLILGVIAFIFNIRFISNTNNTINDTYKHNELIIYIISY